MPGPNKAMLFFGDGRYGWSESYYDTTTGNTLDQTLNKAIILGRVRARMLAQGPPPCSTTICTAPSLQYIRVSDVANPRKTTFANPNGVRITNNGNITPWAVTTPPTGWWQAGANQVLTAPADNPYSAIEMLWEMSDNSVVKRPISGVPDWQVCDQSAATDTAWVGAFQAFAANLVANWGSLSKKAVIAGGVVPNTAVSIKSVTQNAAGQPIIVLTTGWILNAPGSPFTNPCNIHLTVFNYVPAGKGAGTINGTYRAFPQAPNAAGLYDTWLLRQTFKPLSPPAPLCLGWAMPTAPTVLAITDVVMGRPMKKDRGGPFDRPRGKSLKRH